MRGTALVAFLIGLAAVFSHVAEPEPYSIREVSQADIDRSRAYLAQHLLPLPEDWTWGTLETRHGTLRYGTSGVRQADTTYLFVPGFRGNLELYADYFDEWRRRGYGVIGLDLLGQGGSERRPHHPEKPFTGDFRIYGDNVADLVEEIARPLIGDGRRLILVGESFGGHAVLRALQDRNIPADGAVLMVPAVEMATPGFPPPIVDIMTGTMTTLGFGDTYVVGQGPWVLDWTVDPETYRCGTRADRVHLQESWFSLNPEFRVWGVTNEWVGGLQSSGKKLVTNARQAASPLPLKMILAEQDVIVVNDASKAVCTASGDRCTTYMLETAMHCLPLEDDDVITEMHDAMDRFAAGL